MLKRVIILLVLSPLFINSQCIKGDCIYGLGKIIYEDNNSYEGYFKDGLKNGQGTLIEYTDEYKITTKGLFVGDRIVQGEKVMKNLKVPLEAFITITSYSRFGDNKIKDTDNNSTAAEEIFDVIGETDDLSISEITIYNTYNGSFIMKLDSDTYEFKANETKTITIKPGTYNIQALNKCCAPYNAKITLEGGKKYFRRYYVYTVSK
tara:strand:+ start:70 stop:687 length:618 start_codon:yes stop_codon:yes gene_type:complete